MNKLIIPVFLVFTFSLGCTQTNPNPAGNGSDRIVVVLDSLVRANGLPGANLSMVAVDKEIKNYSSGYADLEEEIKINENHLLFSGSIGKTYAAALIMNYVDEGILSLDDYFMQFFPDSLWLQRLPNMEEITIRMLLKHTSGLPRYVMKPVVWDSLSANPDKTWTYYDRLSVIFDDHAVHEAGSGWSYSDTNYILLGMLLEKLGKDYYELVAKILLDPLDLDMTFAADCRDIPGLAAGYSRLPELFRMPRKVVTDGLYVFNPQLEWTGGGFVSTTSDLARWASIYYNGQLFSDSLMILISTPSHHGSDISPGMSYGMGSFIYGTGHGDAYAHTGFVPGYNAIFAYYPERGIALALQVNCDFASGELPLIEYLNILLDEL